MKHVPSEIWRNISSEACTDTGFTGLSLSLVSKFVHAASEPVKLQSVALFGPHRITAFDSFLLEVPAHLRRVRYLFISCHSLPTDGVKASRRDQAEVEEQITGAIRRILVNVAEYVEVLEIHAPSDTFYGGPNLPSLPIPLIPFPRLTDLATNGNSHPMRRLVPLHANMNSNSERSLYPRLRNWHLTQVPFLFSNAEMFDFISKLAPFLTHLRISGIGYDESFPNELAAALGIEYSHHGHQFPTDTEFGRLPSSVQKVYVKPSSCDSGGECGTSALTYDETMADLEGLNQLEDERFVLLKAYKRAEERVGTGTADWESAVRGEEGCWSLRDKLPSDGHIEYEDSEFNELEGGNDSGPFD
ncbi:hypothetical protein FIBSPDRAFT_939142 [Athelia psychrophila]|uniref:F-box domain-containing protein n=1 Tax=Athelia psychrophila TaxID=1759441 RepID=A0A165X466_9AGAM|nr:hypothetical protein FIBSPDRAFT_939142 [Fibularhizoctonia sp. CBS 109695]